MFVSKLPSFVHGVHSINNLLLFVNKPAVVCLSSSPIRVFSAFSTSALASGAVSTRSHRQRRSGSGDDCGAKRRNHGVNVVEEDDERGERKVRCEVDVISWRERRIRGEIWVDADVQSVWNALTDYERLADFIPNLVCSGRIPCPHPGRIWLEQRGFQRALYWHIEARVVLDLQECPDSPNGRELHFSMVEGDFKKFEGKWSLTSGTRSKGTVLSYEVNVTPRFNFPAIFLERIIRSDLPVNLRALACQAEKNCKGDGKALVTKNSWGRTSLPASPLHGNDFEGLSPGNDKLSFREFEEHSATSGIVPLPRSNDLNNNWRLFRNVCRLDRPCTVDEVHLRRFDGLLENGGVH